MKVSSGILLSCIFAGCLWSCSARNMMVDEMTKIVGDGIAAFERDDDLDMLEKAFPANIKLMETFLETSPDNCDTLVLLARFYGSYAFLFFEAKLEDDGFRKHMPSPVKSTPANAELARLRETVGGYYRKGAAYALRALEVHHGAGSQRLKTVSTRDDFFQSLAVQDVPALFWYGFNLGGYVNLNRNSVKAISKVDLAEKAMKRVIELNPGYFHGGAHLFLLSFYASRPPMLGGNLKASLSHYHQLKKITGQGYLLADLYYARYYLYQTQDRENYEKTLTTIIEYPATENEFRLYNKVAAIRAKGYLEATDDVFEGKKD